MSKELVCPFCNKKLEPIGTSGQFQCGTWGCDASFNFIATRDVWEYIERTRKALEMTDTALLTIATNLDKVFPDTRLIFETIRIARKRIAEITALEQKE